MIPLVGCGHRAAPHGQSASGFEVSYAAGAAWLRGIDPTEVDDQVRDWTRTALAARLNLDTQSFLRASYDTVPVRDPGFADLSTQQTGPGRLLVGSDGVVHVLVPAGDAHEARTVGQLLDQYRTDHGSDPSRVVVYHYRIRPDVDTVDVTADPARPTAEVRAAYGYVRIRIDSLSGLVDFLSKTQDLSEISTDGSKTWAGGWHWPDVPSVPLDAADVSAIQDGYPVASGSQAPGFSLDPQTPRRSDETPASLRTVIPGLAPALAAAILNDAWAGTGFQSEDDLKRAVEKALFDGEPAGPGLPADRAQLWAVLSLVENHPLYSQARYEGDLAHTSVGMTLFYTDYVAKNWVIGAGDGVPTAAVGGFSPDTGAVTPWSECPDNPEEESGRLWFGQNDSAFAQSGDRFEIGAQATRLFARSNGSDGAEVEPSFAFGRGLRFWDQHYQAIADYEPQYARLDQIMRWSGALEWLTNNGGKLPTEPDADVHHQGLTFRDWYARNTQLRERSPIPFVAPPGATDEAVIPRPTKTFTDCGFLSVEGGVSLGDLTERVGNENYQANLPAQWSRAGLFDSASHVEAATGDGVITQLAVDDSGKISEQVKRTISTAGDHSEVTVSASGRAVIPFRKVKVWRSPTADRTLSTTGSAGHGEVSQQVSYQGQELGTLNARASADIVTIQWRRGVVDRALLTLQSLQDRLARSPGAGLDSVADGPLVTYRDATGEVLAKVGGPGDPWLGAAGTAPPGDGLAFRVGGPAPGSGKPAYTEASFVALAAADRSHPWWDVAPATADHAAQGGHASQPPIGSPAVRVSTPDGKSTTLFVVGDHVRVREDDPILGPDGSAEGTALLAHYPQVAAAVKAAALAHDGYRRGVVLGDDDGVALAGEDGIILVPSDHPWAERVVRAAEADPAYAPPLIQVVGDHVEHVDVGGLTPVPGSRRHGVPLEDVLAQADTPVIYMHDSLRSTLNLRAGLIIPDPLPRGMRVRVNVVLVQALHPAHDPSAAAQPDQRVFNQAKWSKFPTNRASVVNRPGPTSTPTPALAPPLGGDATTSGRAVPGQRVSLFVCPADGPFASACDV